VWLQGEACVAEEDEEKQANTVTYCKEEEE
jgi:hypothetical protein